MSIKCTISGVSAALLVATLSIVAPPTATGRATTNGLWSKDFEAHQVAADCGRWRLDENDFCVANDSRNGLEVGVKFQTSKELSITGIRIYRADPGKVRGSLWESDGTLLARGAFADRDKNGWQDMSFDVPVPIVPGTTYIASYFTPGTRYAFAYQYFATSARTVGPITALRSEDGSPNGVHCYDDAVCGSFPVRGYRNSSYWVTPLWQEAGTPPGDPNDQQAPAVTTTSPAKGATHVKVRATVKVRFSEAMRRSTLRPSTVRLVRKGSRKPVEATVRYDATKHMVVLNPRQALLRGATYRVVISSAVRDRAGNRLDQNPNKSGRQAARWSFRTVG